MNGTRDLGHAAPLEHLAASAGESRAERAARLLAEPPLRRQGQLDKPTRSRAKRDKRSETPGAIRRLARAAARYAADGDEAELAEFGGLIQHLELCRDLVAVAQHQRGRTWQALGDTFGITRQAAHQRWGHLELDDLAAQIERPRRADR